MRQEAEDKSHQLAKKIDFEANVHSQQVNDLRDRLQSSANTILSLESRIRELSKSDNSLVEMLTRVRETAELELRRYKEQSEEDYNRNVSVQIIVLVSCLTHSS